MNSRDYWLMREQEALKHYITDEAKYSRRLKAIYNDMMDSIQMEIDAFYGKYASEEGISINAAKKRVSKLDIEAYERKAKKYVKEHDFSKKANEEMKLYNLTMKVNRLELLKANIGLELVKGYDDIDREMNEILQGRTIEELERQAGILGKTVNNNAATASAIVNASFHNATFSDRIWMHQSLLKAELSKLLQVGLIQGKNPRTLARELRKVFNTSIFNSERLMRTELARVQTEAQKQSYEVNEFGDYEFITNVGCCPICEALDGKHFKVRDMVIGENAPPMHPNCRCSTAPWTDRAEFDAWLDSYKEHGLNFDEWKKARDRGNSLEKSENNNIINMKSNTLRRLSKAGIFVDTKDDLSEYAKKIKPIKGYDDFVCHSTADSFEIYDGEYKMPLSPSKYAELIRRSSDFHDKPIRIISCQAGAKKDGIAQQLADALGVDVLAPTEVVSVDDLGRMFVSDNDTLSMLWFKASDEEKKKFYETGEWRVFSPKLKRE